MAVRRGRGNRLKKAWAFSAIADQTGITTTQGELASITLATGAVAEPTILRTRGSILIVATPDAGTDSDMIGLGLVIVPETTRVVGGASLPGPLTNAGADFWFWHNFVGMDAMGATTEATARTGGTSWARIEIDAKAMRRWPTDTAVVLVAEANTGEFASISVQASFRILTGV